MSRRTLSDRWFDGLNVAFFSLTLVVIIYPLYFVLISSFSDPDAINGGRVWLWPVDMTWNGYRGIFEDSTIWRGYGNSLIYASLGSLISTALTITGGYALSRKDLVGRSPIMLLILFTMFFQGGMIPTYILVKNLGFLDTVWAMIIPGAISVYQLIIVRTFFQQTIPDELLEAAMMDGCNNMKFFFQIVLPLSTPIVAVIILLNAVSQWNSYFQALIYLKSDELQPLQIILRRILVQNQTTVGSMDWQTAEEMLERAELIKYGVVIVASLPMLILYPFLQKYFVKGIMLGSVKG
jgi:putative aldouronate transport system permease protein